MSRDQHTFRPSIEKRRILLVEDDLMNQELLKMYLEETYELVLAETGRQALEIIQARHETLSLVLLDLNLPDIHGLEVLTKLRADVLYAHLPVIVMTADSESEVACLDRGAIDFIPKPYPTKEVVHARVRRTIEFSEDRNLIHWTERDALSGLYNKDFFYRYALQLDAYHPEAPADAVLLNINGFHTLNDRYGKEYGDEVLRCIGAHLLTHVQEAGGIACRSEADSFLLYVPHREDYESLLADLQACLRGADQQENRVHLRVGIYSRVDKKLDIERRFDRAKMAADTVRGSYTRQTGLFDESMHDRELRNGQLTEDFPAALREKQLQVYFQPKYSIQGRQPVLASAEALIRWKHPRLGMISPGEFIPLFENTGLIRQLDFYVWQETAARIRDWRDRLGILLPVSVNVSRIDLLDPQLVEKLQRVVEEAGLTFNDLVLEVTESAYTDNPEQIIETVSALRNLGFRIEMDDFGSGYSSLHMLSALPIDALKLDMQFVRNAFRERKDTRLLEAMIHLAESFGFLTIAEGVETAEQVFTLKSMGCDLIQGYYFSRPLPPEEFERHLQESQSRAAMLPSQAPREAFELRLQTLTETILKDYTHGRVIDQLELYTQPDQQVIHDLIQKLMRLVLPGFFQDHSYRIYHPKTSLSTLTEDVAFHLNRQIALTLRECEDAAGRAQDITAAFLARLPEIRALVEKDLQAAYDGDPAASSKAEVIIAYPGFHAITINRLAHALFQLQVPLIPRIMTEYAHSRTGIDIHPGAQIGEYFFIDHGTGIVVGETTVIGDHVKIYQGVTLGALSTRGGQKLHGQRRHPTIEDRVTIYAGASILGGETVIGHDSVIGSNVFITRPVPPFTRISIRNQELQYKNGEGYVFTPEDVAEDDSWTKE